MPFSIKKQIMARGNLTVLEIMAGVSERLYLLMDSHYPFWDKLIHSIKFLVCKPRVLQLFILRQIQQGFKPFCHFSSGPYSPSLVKLTLCLVTGTNHWSKMLQFSSQAENKVFWYVIENFTQNSDMLYLIHVTPTSFSEFTEQSYIFLWIYGVWVKWSSVKKVLITGKFLLNISRPSFFFFYLVMSPVFFIFYAMLFLWINPFTKAVVYPGFTFFLKAIDILVRC